MFEERTTRDTSKLAMLMFRVGIVVVFVVMVARMYQLQVMRSDEYRTLADENRLVRIETSAPRGVVYDRNGTILVRNRPSFEVALIPEHLPEDDPDTDIDEEAQEIEKVLKILRADSDSAVALRMAEMMFKKLGYDDFTRTVQKAGVEVKLLKDPAFVAPTLEDGRLVKAEPRKVYFPDIEQQLPLPGLVALVKRAVTIERQGSASDPVPILDGVDRIRAFEVSEESFRIPAVRVNQVPIREYIYGDLLSQVLGFMGPIPAILADDYKTSGYNDPNEKVGLNGLEFSYQDEMRGTPGLRFVERDILGTDVRTVGPVREPVPGLNLYLGIDLRLQRIMYDRLKAAIPDETKTPWAVAVAMNPQNGQILGMVSLPSYDNNIFAETIGDDYLKLEKDKRRPLINYAIGGLYPPGSTFKMITASAALAEGVVTRDTKITDAGPIFLKNRYFPNDMSQAQKFVSWNHKLGITHGPIDVVQALALSNDIYFYILGGGFPDEYTGLGQKRLAKWMDLYGYGKNTGIDLPGEVASPIPTDQWKRQLFAETWTTGDSYNEAIGQGYVLATPLQVLVEAATVANGGTVYEPRVVHHMTDATGGLQKDFEPVVARKLPISAEDMDAVRQGMWNAVNSDYGTAIVARVPGVEVAGKTGTAEFCEYVPEKQDCRRDEHDNLPTHAWFTAFAPYENPEIAVVVFVYNGGEGSLVAAPVAQQIMQAYFTEIAPRPQPQPVAQDQ